MEIDGPNKKAKFIGFGEANKDQEYWVSYDMIHVTPPQSAPDFIRNSPLANTAGWIDVEKHTLQHNKYKNSDSEDSDIENKDKRNMMTFMKLPPVKQPVDYNIIKVRLKLIFSEQSRK